MKPRDSYDKVVEALRVHGCGEAGNGFRCPAHDDEHASLVVSRGTRREVVLHCHAGCPPERVVRAVGLDPAKILRARASVAKSPAPRGTRRSTQRRPEAEYVYENEHRQPLYAVLRYPGKRFVQVRIDDDGRRVIGSGCMKGVRRVLYRLPELLTAIEDNKSVYLPEGEKDANALHDAGFVATCNSGGAGKWREEYSEVLRGASDVRIIADKDMAGYRHAEAVRRSLRGVGVEARVLEARVGKDVSDHMAAGHTLDKLVEIDPSSKRPSQNARTPILTRVADVQAQAVDFLEDPRVPLGKLTILEGDPGMGKTTVALHGLVAPLSKGRGLLGSSRNTKPGKSLYLTAEDGIADTIRPRLDAAGADVRRVFVLDGYRDGDGERREVTLADLDVLERALAEIKPKLVIIDPLQGFLGAQVDMHRSNEVRPILAGLARLAEKFNCAIVLIRHLRKQMSERAVYRGLGSIDFAAAVRSILVVGQDPRDRTGMRRVVAHVKSNLAARGESLGFTLHGGRFSWVGPVDIDAEALLQGAERAPRRSEAKGFLIERLAKGARPKDLFREAKRARISRRTLKRAKKELGIQSRKTSKGWMCEKPR